MLVMKQQVANLFFFFKQKTAYEIDCDWSSDVCSSDPGSDRFFSSAVYSAGATPEFMTGTLDAAAPLVTFSSIVTAPVASPAEPLVPASILTMLDQNHFAWTARDRAWRAMFTRQE